jgi:hypothetical protein
VHRYGTPSLSDEDVARLAADTATRRVVVDQPAPIVLRYETVEIRNDSVFVYRDIYKLERVGPTVAVREKLVEYGVDAASIDTARVRAITRSIPRRGRGVPIAQLTNGG